MAHMIGIKGWSPDPAGFFAKVSANLGPLLRAVDETDREPFEVKQVMSESEGERLVAGQLAKLPNEYVVFGDVCFKGPGRDALERRADYVVVGPTGLFVVEGKGGVDGDITMDEESPTEEDIRRVKAEADDLMQCLLRWSGGSLKDIWVEGLVVYADPGPHAHMVVQAWPNAVPSGLVGQTIVGHDGYELDIDTVLATARALFSQYPKPVQDRFRPEMRAASEYLARLR